MNEHARSGIRHRPDRICIAAPRAAYVQYVAVIRFFLHRPTFASVCAALILLAGAVVIPILPIAQSPKPTATRILILNADFLPLNFVSTARATRLVLAGRAEIIRELGAVHSVTVTIPLPTIIRMLTFIRSRPRRVAPVRSIQRLIVLRFCEKWIKYWVKARSLGSPRIRGTTPCKLWRCMANSAEDEKRINTIRFLAVDAVQKANSGHPGMPLGAAAAAYTLWSHQMQFDPADPKWFNRDRFVLSAGHASAMLYALLHSSVTTLRSTTSSRSANWGAERPVIRNITTRSASR
jgi:hypothetical protein